MDNQERIPTYTPEELQTIRDDIKRYCRLHSLLNRIYQMREELEDIETNLSRYGSSPVFDRLCGGNPSAEHINCLLQIIEGEERDRTAFDQHDLDCLKDMIQGYLPDDSPEEGGTS